MYIALEIKRSVVEKHYFTYGDLRALRLLQDKLYNPPKNQIQYDFYLTDNQFNRIGEIDHIDLEYHIEQLEQQD